MKIKSFFLCIFTILLFTTVENISAESEPILITKSPSMENVIFDGKWTNFSEWKQSSHNAYFFDDEGITIHLRTAHFEDYIYVFVDSVDDLTYDELMDKVTLCFDGKNNKNNFYDADDFCFSILLGDNQGSVFQGNFTGESSSMEKIPSPDDFIAIATISDENDRYTKTPHTSYEFKIPIKLLERSDNYGFYFSVYDASSNKHYSWPENSSNIPSPSKWGDIVSPDKSLPELNFPTLIFTILIFTVILAQSKMRIGFLQK